MLRGLRERPLGAALPWRHHHHFLLLLVLVLVLVLGVTLTSAVAVQCGLGGLVRLPAAQNSYKEGIGPDRESERAVSGNGAT